MSTVVSLNRARPRKASAGTRRHHRTYLPYRIGLVLPGAHTVLVTPVHWVANGRRAVAFHVVYFTAEGRRIQPDREQATRAVQLLRGAFPNTDWERSQIWRADTNQPDPWQPATWGSGGAA